MNKSEQVTLRLSREEVTEVEQCLLAEQARLCEVMSEYALEGYVEGVRSCMEAFDIAAGVVRKLAPARPV